MVRPDSRVWFPFASSFSTGATVICAYLFGQDPRSPWVAVFAGAIGAVFFWVFEFLTTELMENQGFRRQFDFKRARFEGEWMEFYREERVDPVSGLNSYELKYAYFRIRYTGKSGEPYLLKGNAYDSTGHNYARWASKVIKFDGNKGIIDYFYFGYFFEKNFSVRGMANLSFDDRTSYAVMPADNEPPNDMRRKSSSYRPQATSFNSGTGYFIDASAAGTIHTKFHFIRIDDELVKALFGSDSVDDLDAERQFVVRFHKKFGDGILRDDYLTIGSRRV